MAKLPETHTRNNATSKDVHDVLIIGAGIAGISAGKRLTELGIHDFVILEARNRIGGRAYNIQFAGNTFAAGPLWLHGKKTNPLAKLAHKYGLEIRQFSEFKVVMRNSDGEDISESFVKLTDQFDRVSDLVETEMKERIDSKIPFSDPSCREAYAKHGWNPSTVVERVFDYHWFELKCGINAEYGSMLVDYLTGLAYSMDDDYNSDCLLVSPRGYVDLVEAIAKEYLSHEDARLKLQSVVSRVTRSSDCVHVTTTSGERYSARFAIVTLPNDVIYRSDIIFEPELPPEKLTVLRKLRANNYSRVFVKFPTNIRPFWDNAEKILHVSDRVGHFTYWQNAAACDLCPTEMNILISHIAGPEADRILKLSKDQVIEEVTEVMAAMYPQSFVPPEDVLVASLVEDPFSRGAFSCGFGPMTPEDGEWVRRNVGPLHFAGDGASFEYNGYAQGAFLTGQWCSEAIHKEMTFKRGVMNANL